MVETVARELRFTNANGNEVVVRVEKVNDTVRLKIAGIDIGKTLDADAIDNNLLIGSLICEHYGLLGYADTESCFFKTDKYEGEMYGKPLTPDGDKNYCITLKYNKIGETEQKQLEIDNICILDYNLSRQEIVKCLTD